MANKRKRKKSLYRKIKENEKAQKVFSFLFPALFGIVLVTLWQNGNFNSWFHADTFTLPLPTKIVSIMVENKEKIWGNALSTIFVGTIGLAVGSVFGYTIAVIAALFQKWGSAGLNIVGAFASIPVVALAPVMTNWTKDVSKDANVRSMVAKIIVVALIAAADMTLNAYRGLTELMPYSEDLMATYAAGKRTTLSKLRLPNSVPYIFTALKVSVPASIMTAIVSEYFAEYITGVGRQIRENIVLAQYATAWAYIFAACLIGVVMYMILMLIQSILLRKHVS